MADIAGTKSLRDIVDNFVYKYKLPIDDASILFEHACMCYRDIRVKHGDAINTEYVNVDASGLVDMPKSLLSFLAIGIYINSQLWTFTEKPSLEIPTVTAEVADSAPTADSTEVTVDSTVITVDSI